MTWLDSITDKALDRALPARSEAVAVLASGDDIRAGGGRDVLAIGRLSVGAGWAGITAVEVDPALRRAGLGTALTLGICAEAASRAVQRVFLQVETANMAARALYERIGFG
jgi:ribosomal protein S18 acetylase RimI-like enzyme